MTKYFTQILIGSGFVGFTLTLLLYFKLLDLKHGTFHEISIDSNALIDSFNVSRLQKIQPLIRQIDSMTILTKTFSRENNLVDSASLSLRIDSIKKYQLNVRNDSDYVTLATKSSLSNDSLRKYRSGKVLKLANATEVNAQLFQRDQTTYQFEFLLADTMNAEFPFRKNYPVVAKPFSSNIDFFIKYPSFGVWALLVTTLISIWFILTIIFFAGLNQFKKKLSNSLSLTGITLNNKKIAGYIAFSFLLVMAFFIVGKLTVYDKYNIVPVHMFIHFYMGKFYILLGSGLIVAGIFFGGYLIMGDILKECSLLSGAANTSKEKQDQITELRILAHTNLDKYFITTAFSLTGVTIITGVLFTAINTMDFGKLYYTSFQRNFLSFDIVYLFGALYSILILLFYLPFRLSFNNIDLVKPGTVSEEDKKDIPFYRSKDFLTRSKEIFTISTPLLAGLIQLVIEIFSNK
ncbi:MAG TPA: hypothetical protein PLC48_00910 [Ferruginibacter sp.]|nr:hypothetical protein [Ferruginibacter sp.]